MQQLLYESTGTGTTLNHNSVNIPASTRTNQPTNKQKNDAETEPARQS